MNIKTPIHILILLIIFTSCTSLNNNNNLNYYTPPANTSPDTPSSSVIIGGPDGDYESLKEALNLTPENITRFILSEGIYTEAGLIISRDAEIIGAGRERTIIQGSENSGEAPDRIITIMEETRVGLSGLTVKETELPGKFCGEAAES